MSCRRAVRLLVLIATVAVVLPWPAAPALAFTEGPSDNYFGTGAGAGDTGTNSGDHDNSFFGGNAGNANTVGIRNSFFGHQAGLENTNGTDNSYFGVNTGALGTVGQRNSFFGRAAGFDNTASDNSFFGYFAGQNNTTGDRNAFFGTNAGDSNTSGGSNAFFGTSAGLHNTTGGSNAFFAGGAGFNNTTGSLNAFFGVGAGISNTTENFNSFLGAFSNGAGGITNATAVGHRAQVSQSDSLVLGPIAGLNGAGSDTRVGIGTPTPADPLHVRRTDGNAKVLVEEASGTTFGRELFQLTNNGAARFRLENTANNAVWDFQSSSGAGSFVIDKVGGPASLDFEVQPDGDLVMRGSVTGTSFISSSDRNLKTDIAPANASKLMSMLRELDISTWRFKDESKGTVNLGPMAQDFHRLFGMGTDTTIDVRDLAALALVAAQAQQKEIDDLKRAFAARTVTPG